jgi:hypothetical protein
MCVVLTLIRCVERDGTLPVWLESDWTHLTVSRAVEGFRVMVTRLVVDRQPFEGGFLVSVVDLLDTKQKEGVLASLKLSHPHLFSTVA